MRTGWQFTDMVPKFRHIFPTFNDKLTSSSFFSYQPYLSVLVVVVCVVVVVVLFAKTGLALE